MNPLVLPLVLLLAQQARGAPDYERDIKPLLKERCYTCHGALKQKAGLRLDTLAAMRAGGDTGNILLTDHPLMVERVATSDLEERMPPEGEGAAFSPDQVALLKTWILAGAPGPAEESPEPDPRNHWAYHAPQSSGKSLDALLADAHTTRALKPQPAAPPELWLRRVHLDLIGLPPSPQEVQTFLHQLDASTNPDSVRSQVVDRLLALPQYGERWGRHFMDIWRYSDWYGLGAQLRYSQKHLWHWRDWIIESLNQDKSYDQMIVQMLAADELDPNDRDNLRATGFLARSYYLFNRTTWLDATIEHTSRAFLGLTMQCVKCHDHKYDPVDHAEYYRMRAIFEPMHVRLDPVPGETDFEKDGLPRVFDLHVDRPTYRHVRGDEANVDQSRALPPGVPAVLSWADFKPLPVALPQTAVQPGLQPFVFQNHLSQAQTAIAAARRRLEQTPPNPQPHSEWNQAKLALTAAELKLETLHAVDAAQKAPSNSKLAVKAAALDARLQETVARLAVIKTEADLALTGTNAAKKAATQKTLKTQQEALAKAQKKARQPGSSFSPIPASFKAKEGPDDDHNALVQRYPETTTGRRLAFARWMTDRHHPLTARVLVNQVWLRHFGSSLVEDVTDFGRRTPPPLLQPVLDTLAVRFMEQNWSLKTLHREMVLSELYARTSSNAHADTATLTADPDNRFYWRMNPRRMESQIVRDSLLHLSGKLDLTLGGPTIDPLKQETVPRRSLYFNQTAFDQHRFLGGFDNANVLECYRREESVTPQQALALTNSQVSFDSAQALTARLTSLDDTSFIREAFLSILSRPPTAAESRLCTASLHEMNRERLLQALLNHNDFVTIR